MKRITRRTTAAILAGVLSVSLAACGDDDDTIEQEVDSEVDEEREDVEEEREEIDEEIQEEKEQILDG